MARNVKCRWCGLTDTPKDEMEFELVGNAKPVKKYYHKNCYKEFLEDKKFKEEEALELDSLKKTVEDIFGIQQLPNQAYPFLQKLRNGEQVFGRQTMGKRYKEGYKYSLIEEAFRHCEDTIQYWLGVKDFNGFMGAFKYSLSIVIDKIYIVEQRVQERESKQAMIDSHVNRVVSEDDFFESNYKKPSKKKEENDLLDFLDE